MAVTFNNSELHRILGDALAEQRVSDASKWSDTVWQFKMHTAGHPDSRAAFNFQIELFAETEDHEAEYLTDTKWARLLDETKRFIWSLLKEPQSQRRRPSPSSLSHVQRHVAMFLRWMVRQGFTSFGEVPGSLVESSYPTFVVKSTVNYGEEEVTMQTIRDYIQIPMKLWQQNAAMAEGIHLLRERPYEQTAEVIAKKYVAKIAAAIPAVPADAFIALTSEMLAWVEHRSRDAILLNNKYYCDACAGAGAAGDAELATARREMFQSFRFSSLPGQKTPWRPSLDHDIPSEAIGRGDRLVDADGKQIKPGQLVLWPRAKGVVTDAGMASAMMLQALLGVRTSELLGLRSEPFNAATGLPACVEIEDTLSGHYEAFYIRGYLYKGVDDYEEVRWAAGIRPKGASEVPLAVQAVLAIHYIYKPWRDQTKDENGNYCQPNLLVSCSHSSFPKDGGEVAPLSLRRYTRSCAVWIAAHVPAVKGIRITSHMWRKSYALQMYMADPGLLPAVSQHFKHASTQVTFEGYIKNADRDLEHLRVDVAHAQTAELIQKIRHGGIAVGGELFEMLLNDKERFDRYFAGVLEEDEYEAILAEVEAADVRSHECDWGRCLFREEWARCGGARGPDYVNRTASVCSECKNLVVLERHRGYWERRLRRSRASAQDLERVGEIASADVARGRAAQAEHALAQLNRRRGNAA